MQEKSNKKSVALRCTCGNTDLEWLDPLTPETLLRCPECERVFAFVDLASRMALEAYDPAAALSTDDIDAELVRQEIHVTGVHIEDRMVKK